MEDQLLLQIEKFFWLLLELGELEARGGVSGSFHRQKNIW